MSESAGHRDCVPDHPRHHRHPGAPGLGAQHPGERHHHPGHRAVCGLHPPLRHHVQTSRTRGQRQVRQLSSLFCLVVKFERRSTCQKVLSRESIFRQFGLIVTLFFIEVFKILNKRNC